ncbi:hypothetical protein HF577_33745 [Pseudonocardia xinjiangensis]|uniref:Uncharacterized protein n=1 Tax=Pseudonocardia xinjiangensis TaxID=75289 RepID=A0ABX1RR83_9PSEU|nr:hypothetical protein [Pseudonocardia xinjiangensis]NMH82039.1 hypothetical protein [Pseudonocardia xinjiangensis]
MTNQHLMERTPVEALRMDRGALRAEFDAIIAANFPDAAGQLRRLPPRRAAAVTAAVAPLDADGAPPPPEPTPEGGPARDIRARQRGPPFRTPPDDGFPTATAPTAPALHRQEVITRTT